MSTLHLVDIKIDARSLYTWAAENNIPSEDVGYACHSLLCAAYGDLRPKPFSATERPGKVRILGYAACGAARLREERLLIAEPSVSGAIASEESKEMPTSWADGRRLGFELRVAPTRQQNRSKSEKDAYLFVAEQGVSREEAYKAWLLDRIGNAAEIESITIDAFRLMHATRRRHEGEKRVLGGITIPDVTFRGALTVKNGETFRHLIENGVGRHKAFGFGALLLRHTRA